MIVDDSHPLLISSVGNYRLEKRDINETKRPYGRKDYQLLYIAAGKATFIFNGKETMIKEGTVVIYRPDEPQEYYYRKEDQTDVYWLHFTGRDIEKLLNHYGIEKDMHVIRTGTSKDFVHIMRQMILELQLCRSGFDEILNMLLRTLLIEIRRSMEGNRIFDNEAESAVTMAIRYFRRNYNTEINIDEYAAAAHISSGWFIRSFKNQTGMTPLSFILNLRISNAESLLESTDYSIEEIAQSVGYENPLYFSRLFRNHTGVSPSAYRKNSRNKI